MREIVLDTETTGLSPKSGHRIVEIGCLELINHIPTGKSFHTYINPERDMPPEAFRVHGLSEEFLSTHRVFKSVVGEFMDFLEDSPLVIHNAEFDMRFLDAELEWTNTSILTGTRSVVDTIVMARRKFPGAPANLDALCKRFQIDTTKRTKHGAIVDCELLAEVYIELLGGRQRGFSFSGAAASEEVMQMAPIQRTNRPKRIFMPTITEIESHDEMVDQIKNSLWKVG
jgi:DNA polymerase III subunit epsilon